MMTSNLIWSKLRYNQHKHLISHNLNSLQFLLRHFGLNTNKYYLTCSVNFSNPLHKHHGSSFKTKIIVGGNRTMSLERVNYTADKFQKSQGTDNGANCHRIIAPPIQKGMTKLNRAAFDKEISVPSLQIPEAKLTHLLPALKPFFLKIKKLQNVIAIDGVDKKQVLLDPEKVTDFEEFLKGISILQNEQEVLESATFETVTLNYDHWTINQLMSSILPDDKEKFASFSTTGHVIHVNLRDHLLPYKHIIGEILLDKCPYAKTIVNKLDQIESEYRNFQMEIIAGESNTVVQLKENKCEFEFDFAKVYWNSRLSSEHETIVKFLKRNFIVFDVFAGVGPFAIPAAKKKCVVLANDLNPDSTKWLQRNVEKNKVTDYVQVYNQDGRVFIREVISRYLKDKLKKIELHEEGLEYHVIMNLPAIAVDFLEAFWNILGNDDDSNAVNSADINEKGDSPLNSPLPQHFELRVHVYCFIKDISNHEELALQLVKDKLKYNLRSDNIIEVSNVRAVAPNKEMIRVSFKMPHEVLRGFSTPQINQRKRKHAESDTNEGCLN